MMKIENQLCTVEQAMKLKELGITQQSSFYWGVKAECVQGEMYVTSDMAADAGDMSYAGSVYQNPIWEYVLFLSYGWDDDDNVTPHYSAFTVSEFGVMLPARPRTKDYNALAILDERQLSLTDEAKKLPYNFCKVGQYKSIDRYTTEAQGRAALLIYMIENNLITVEEVNKQLTNS